MNQHHIILAAVLAGMLLLLLLPRAETFSCYPGQKFVDGKCTSTEVWESSGS